MIYHIAKQLQRYYSFFNMFHYVSFRAIVALLSAIFLSFVCGSWFIKASQKNFKVRPREWTPENHLKKGKTPTMGGIFIIIVCILNTLLWCNLGKISVWLFLFCLVGFGLIGFLDDWRKLHYSNGISARLKFGLQVFWALVIMVSWHLLVSPNASLCIPFLKKYMPYLGLWLIPWGVLVIVGTSNAVNLTDGLDGLATGPLMANFATFSVIAYLAGHRYLAHYLHIIFTGSSEIAVIGATLVGILLGFLWYNTYPAQIFMGDVGSLALGAGLAFMALIARQEILLLLAGGIFVFETLSVIIQVFTFKLFGKRMFKMAPIHHHYELLGWKEAKITVRFWIVSIILSLLTLLTLKIR